MNPQIEHVLLALVIGFGLGILAASLVITHLNLRTKIDDAESALHLRLAKIEQSIAGIFYRSQAAAAPVAAPAPAPAEPAAAAQPPAT